VTASDDGYFYYGRPEWLGEEILADLAAEAEQLRRDAVLLRRQHHSPGGPKAFEFANSAELHALIRTHAGPAHESERANYLYYDEPGQGIDPHADVDAFQLNVLMTIEHLHDGGPGSTLVLFPRGPEHPVRIHQKPGELVLFWATEVFHARTKVTGTERVLNLGIGYQAAFAMPASPYWAPVN
jgi:hypothetical protein